MKHVRIGMGGKPPQEDHTRADRMEAGTSTSSVKSRAVPLPLTHDPSAETARRLKQLLIESSLLVEQYTRQVCPSCIDVCCKQRHGLFTETDRAYITSLAESVPLHDPTRPLDGPCQFLTGTGCSKPRWQRAWKCTWYFCEPLLRTLDEGPQTKARRMSAMLEEMGRLYDEVLKEHK